MKHFVWLQQKLFRRGKCVPNAAKRLLEKESCKKEPGKARIMPSKAAATTASSGRRGKTRKGQLAPEELRTPAVTILPSTFAKKAWVNAGLNIWPIVATILSHPTTVAQTLMAARPKSKQRASLRQSSLYRRYRSQPLYAWSVSWLVLNDPCLGGLQP